MRLLFLTLSLVFTLPAISQITVTGKLVDEQSGQPIRYGTIAFQSLDSVRLEGVYSSDDGSFSIELHASRYAIRAQMVGYETFVLSELEISSDLDLGPISLKSETTQLDEVVVQAERSRIQNDLGKKTLFIGSDLASSGSTAVDALESLPSVSTTIDGNINVRGSENIIIYVNGKETKRDPKTLRFISADILSKIELITNPSAKYDAEGVAGIINLVYKKSRSTKLDGFVSGTVPFRGSVGINGSISSEKLTLLVNASERRSLWETNEYQDRLTPGDDLLRYNNSVKSEGNGATRDVSLGVAYEPDTSFSMSLELNYLRWDDRADQFQNALFTYQSSGREEVVILNNQVEIEDELTLTFSADKEFSDGSRLQFQIQSGGEDEINRTAYNLLDLDLSQTPIRQAVDLSDETEDQRYYQAKLDYKKPLDRNVQLEVGLVSDHFDYNINQSLRFFESSDFTNLFQVLMWKYAGYVLLENSKSRFEYGLGLRYEFFESESIERATDDLFKQRFENFFPSFQSQYRLGGEGHTLGFNFTRRINRPGFFEVSPFIYYTDPLNLETGNPRLQPEFANLYELTYSNVLGKLSLDLTAFTRATKNVIQQFSRPINENQLLVSYENIGSRSDDGLEWSLALELSDKVEIDASGSGYRSRFDDTDQMIFFQGRWNWQTRLNGRIRLDKEWAIDITPYYRASRFGVQSKSFAQYYLNASIQKGFAEKRGTITLSFQDIFNTRVFGSELFGENFSLSSKFRFQTQRATLSLRYKLIR